MLRREFLTAAMPLTPGAGYVMEIINSQDEDRQEDPLQPPLADILEHFPRDQHQRVSEVIAKAKSAGWLRLGVWGAHRNNPTLKSIVGLDPHSGFIDFLRPSLLR